MTEAEIEQAIQLICKMHDIRLDEIGDADGDKGGRVESAIRSALTWQERIQTIKDKNARGELAIEDSNKEYQEPPLL